MNEPARFTSRIIGPVAEARIRHYRGLPPQPTGGKDTRAEMEAPALLLIKQSPDGVFLFRYTADGQVVGDTWHMTVDDAKAQAQHEYGESLSPWKSVPTNVKDVVAFGFENETE